MRKGLTIAVISSFALSMVAAAAFGAVKYNIDPSHTSVVFKIEHIGISWVYGMFTHVEGSFTVDKDDPTKDSFELTIRADSINTNNEQRDKHLRSADFFDTKQFPSITFKSTSVKAVEGGLEVTGDLKIKSTTKAVTFTLTGGKEGKLGSSERIGYSTELVIKRSDFGVGLAQFKNALGDDVHIMISFEGVATK